MKTLTSLTRFVQQNASSTTGLEEGFHDWVRWLRSVTDPAGHAPPEHPAVPHADPDEGNEAPADSAAELRWQDDGGESDETV